MYRKRTFEEYIRLLEDRWGTSEHSYPTKPMGGSNPYYCCTYCGETDPGISISGHHKGCRWVQMYRSVQGLKKVLAVQNEEKARADCL